LASSGSFPFNMEHPASLSSSHDVDYGEYRCIAQADLFAAKGSDGRAKAALIAVAGMAREEIGR